MPARLSNETDAVVFLPSREIAGDPYALSTATAALKYDALTSTLLNEYADVITPTASGGNVTCAIVSDAFTLNLTDSEEDDERTLCDPGNSVDLTDFNFDADITGFRDANKADLTSVFNLWRKLTFGPDVPYIIVHRVGYASDVPFAAGQEIDVYYAWTDLPIDVHADGEKQKIQSVMVPKSVVKISYVLAA